jgi:TorA maturation chaperone TorD
MNEAPNESLVEEAISIARQSVYRFTAVSLLDSRPGAWEKLREIEQGRLVCDAAAFLRTEPRAAATTLAPGERPLADLDPEFVLSRLPKTRAKFNDNYERTFGLLVSSNCPPYETEYINSKFDFQRSNGLADIAGFYRAFGLERSSSYPERHDHIVLELEFMAYLIWLERLATRNDGSEWRERASTCRRAQHQFVKHHLAWWIPAFARLLALQDPNGFYEAVGHFLAAFVAAERSMLGVEATCHPTADQPTPSLIERPEVCEGCAIAQ